MVLGKVVEVDLVTWRGDNMVWGKGQAILTDIDIECLAESERSEGEGRKRDDGRMHCDDLCEKTVVVDRQRAMVGNVTRKLIKTDARKHAFARQYERKRK